MKIRIFLALLLFLQVASVQAQRGKSVRNKPTEEELAQQEKIARMQAATERVMFIDSMVVDKKDFLRAYRMSSETGTINPTAEFLRDYHSSDSYAFTNELNTKCYFSRQLTDSTSMLYMSEWENGMWDDPVQLAGINDDGQFRTLNYPFMMGDGVTMYFAAEGEGGLGGYDIYMTTYNDESNGFLHPVNIGMPFNSEANDYMYVIDEYDSLGWFATDRRQPEGKVCVYVFVPSAIRQGYDAEEYEPEQIAAFAQIASISDTWTDEQRLRDAQQRLRQHSASRRQMAEQQPVFIINDRVTYHSVSDFRHPSNAERYKQLTSLFERQQSVTGNLNKARNYYAMATQEERSQLMAEILSDEQLTLQLHEKIHSLEKTIRNDEIIFLTNNN